MAKKQLPAKGKSRGKGSRYDRFVVIGIIVAVLAIGLTLWGPLKKSRFPDEKHPAKKAEKAQPKQSAEKPEKMEKKEKPGTREARETKKRKETALVRPEKPALVAIVIDDLGQDLKAAREIVALPARITIAVMPGLPQSRGVAELAKKNNRELLLHLPMEYRSRNGKPAPGMLRSDMTPMDFLTTLTDDVASVPGAVGVNNHEGSSLTENKEAMKFLMAELKSRELIFLDSMTSSKSIAFATAREFGLKAAKRDVFLDNDSTSAASIEKQLEELGRIAHEHGRAIGIGHPHPATVTALRKWLSEADQQGLTIVPVSKLMQ